MNKPEMIITIEGVQGVGKGKLAYLLKKHFEFFGKVVELQDGYKIKTNRNRRIDSIEILIKIKERLICKIK